MPPAERRRQLLDVAAEVFARKGYRLTTVTDIVVGAQVGRGTFYLYFDSKKSIFLELVEQYFDRFQKILDGNWELLEGAVNSGANAMPVWRENLLRILEFHRENKELTQVVYLEAMGRDSDFSRRASKLSDVVQQRFIKQFALMDETGVVRPYDPGIVTTMIMGSVIYLIMEHVVKDAHCNIERLADEIMDYHVRALIREGLDPEAAMNVSASPRRDSGEAV